MGSINLGYLDAESKFYFVDVWTRFYTVQDEVVFMRVEALRPLAGYGLAEFQRDWRPYFLTSIVAQFGHPPLVYLLPITTAEPGSSIEVMLLFYPDQGINVSYEFRVTPVGEEKKAKELCLSSSNLRRVQLSLFLPEYAELWPVYLLPPEMNPEVAEYFKDNTWEKRTGQSFMESYGPPDTLEQRCVPLR